MACKDDFNQAVANGRPVGQGATDEPGQVIKKTGCGCNGSGPKYEPLTKQWFKEWAGVITLVVTLVILITNK